MLNIQENIKTAHQYFVAGNRNQTTTICEQILRTDPNQPEALHLLGLCKYFAGNVDECLSLFNKALVAQPNFAKCLHDQGEVLGSIGKLEEAETSFRRAMDLVPQFSAAQTSLAKLLRQLQRIDEAEKHYRAVTEYDPKNVSALAGLGTLLFQKRENEESVKCLQKALQLAPNLAALHNALGQSLQSTGQGEAAIASFRRATELDPELTMAWMNLGLQLKSLGKVSESLPCFKKANTPHSRAAYLEALLVLEQYDEFSTALDEQIKIDGTNRQIAALSAYASEQLGRPDPYPFCPNPFDYIRSVNLLSNNDKERQFLQELITEATAHQAIWEPRYISTRQGFQTEPNLLINPTGALKKLKSLLEGALADYHQSIKTGSTQLALHWPENFTFKAWFVRLLQGGHQLVHSHPNGWLSGCLYLDVPAVPAGSNEGCIEFTLKDIEYPEISGESKTRIIVPQNGMLALFPSSLLHRTIPFSADTERLCIAFDMVPVNAKA